MSPCIGPRNLGNYTYQERCLHGLWSRQLHPGLSSDTCIMQTSDRNAATIYRPTVGVVVKSRGKKYIPNLLCLSIYIICIYACLSINVLCAYVMNAMVFLIYSIWYCHLYGFLVLLSLTSTWFLTSYFCSIMWKWINTGCNFSNGPCLVNKHTHFSWSLWRVVTIVVSMEIKNVSVVVVMEIRYVGFFTGHHLHHKAMTRWCIQQVSWSVPCFHRKCRDSCHFQRKRWCPRTLRHLPIPDQ